MSSGILLVFGKNHDYYWFFENIYFPFFKWFSQQKTASEPARDALISVFAGLWIRGQSPWGIQNTYFSSGACGELKIQGIDRGNALILPLQGSNENTGPDYNGPGYTATHCSQHDSSNFYRQSQSNLIHQSHTDNSSSWGNCQTLCDPVLFENSRFQFSYCSSSFRSCLQYNIIW